MGQSQEPIKGSQLPLDISTCLPPFRSINSSPYRMGAQLREKAAVKGEGHTRKGIGEATKNRPMHLGF